MRGLGCQRESRSLCSLRERNWHPPVMGEKSSSAATHLTPSSSTSSAPLVLFPSASPPFVADPAAAGFPHHHSRSCRHRVSSPPGGPSPPSSHAAEPLLTMGFGINSPNGISANGAALCSTFLCQADFSIPTYQLQLQHFSHRAAPPSHCPGAAAIGVPQLSLSTLISLQAAAGCRRAHFYSVKQPQIHKSPGWPLEKRRCFFFLLSFQEALKERFSVLGWTPKPSSCLSSHSCSAAGMLESPAMPFS